MRLAERKPAGVTKPGGVVSVLSMTTAGVTKPGILRSGRARSFVNPIAPVCKPARTLPARARDVVHIS